MPAITALLERDELCTSVSGGPVGPAGPAELHLPGDAVFGTDFLDPGRRVLLEWPATPGGAPPAPVAGLLGTLEATDRLSIDYAALPRLGAVARLAVLDEARLERRHAQADADALWSIERLALVQATGLDIPTADADMQAMTLLDPARMDAWFVARYGSQLLSLLMQVQFRAPDVRGVIGSLRAGALRAAALR